MKTAIIFGASRGIGAEIAKEFAKNNYYVVINYCHSQTDAENLLSNIISNSGEGIIYKTDVTDYKAISKMIDYVVSYRKTIEVAVVNAGIAKSNLLIDASIEEINSIINTNLLGAIYCCKAVSEQMLKAHAGNIITIGSMWGECGASIESVYSASKGGIISFTKALAKELGYNGINVNCISPGLIDTTMNKNLSKSDIQDLIDNTPSSRIGTVQDIAKAAIWLSSTDASYINGQVISINGGFLI